MTDHMKDGGEQIQAGIRCNLNAAVTNLNGQSTRLYFWWSHTFFQKMFRNLSHHLRRVRMILWNFLKTCHPYASQAIIVIGLCDSLKRTPFFHTGSLGTIFTGFYLFRPFLQPTLSGCHSCYRVHGSTSLKMVKKVEYWTFLTVYRIDSIIT